MSQKGDPLFAINPRLTADLKISIWDSEVSSRSSVDILALRGDSTEQKKKLKMRRNYYQKSEQLSVIHHKCLKIFITSKGVSYKINESLNWIGNPSSKFNGAGRTDRPSSKRKRHSWNNWQQSDTFFKSVISLLSDSQDDVQTELPEWLKCIFHYAGLIRSVSWNLNTAQILIRLKPRSLQNRKCAL